MSLVDEMQNLREGIESGRKTRKRRIKEIKEDLNTFMEDASQRRKEDFKALTEEVNRFIADLKEDVKTSQGENQAKQKKLKKMLAEAKAAFWGKKRPAKKAAEKGGES